MVGWHHRLDGHEFEQTLGDGKEQGSLACCSPWSHKESDPTQRLNNEQQQPVKMNANESTFQLLGMCLRKINS